MNELIPWDPFNDLFSFGDSFNRNFGGFWQPSVDVLERSDSFIVRANLPGMDKDNVQLSIDDNSLVIKGETAADETSKDEHFYRRERRFGSFMRRIPLHARIKEDQIRATFKNGLLEVMLPKSEGTTEQGRPIEIQ